jgi:hypothetical protein
MQVPINKPHRPGEAAKDPYGIIGAGGGSVEGAKGCCIRATYDRWSAASLQSDLPTSEQNGEA